MSKLKAYILKDNRSEVFAVSESKAMMHEFILQNDYRHKGFSLSIAYDNDAEYALIAYNDLYLDIFYKEYIVRFKDIKPLADIVYDTEYKIRTTIETLDILIDLDKVHKNSVIASMRDTKKYLKKNMKEILDVYGVIKAYYNSPNLMELLDDYDRTTSVFC